MTEPAPIYVSKHATRRYLERAKGLSVPGSDDAEALLALERAGADVEGARALVERIAAPAIAMGAASIRLGKLRYLIKGTCVLSVVPVHGRLDGGRRMRAGAAP